ncbi:DNA segregation ATPase FtsK/SpoIIIE, S-DNA-T family [Fictibacillus enclensis]|uniref:Cell division protein FtsK n=1 Tax=Fictibacillus enclensis TaxID=1017270 RepID=A0A0V8JD92_9BACL|nr:DNA translocase FtsK [Fictibacillus enclensis]KSU85122.1 cell division protein FtsK [Fictibacillus enclensis]SCB91323.1 DNA segregation ATPase FtsK/SpoIIIE, S-DNA-T family [Fictibacillus enclensis]
MAKRNKKTSKKTSAWKEQLSFELAGLLLLALTLLALAKMGKVGQAFVQFLKFFSGEWYGVLLIGTLVIAIYLIWKRKSPPVWGKRLAGFYLFYISMLILSHLKLFSLLSKQGKWSDPSVIRNTWEIYWSQLSGSIPQGDLGGGMIGAVGFAMFHFLFGVQGSAVILVFVMIIAIILITGKSLSGVIAKLAEAVGSLSSTAYESFQNKRQELKENRKKVHRQAPTRSQEPAEAHQETRTMDEEYEPIIEDFTRNVHDDESPAVQLKFGSKGFHEEPETQTETSHAPTEDKQDGLPASFEQTEEEHNENYLLPSMDLLVRPTSTGQHKERQYSASKSNAKKLEKTFESFGVKARVLKVHLGPAVTKYEVYPDVGVKVSKIVNLADDIALALAAKDIRIEAPIPGKSAVGIEVPNQEVATVTLREVLESSQYQKQTSKLAIGLGRDISGEPIFAELSRMPHLLVAGATGSGKSVCINGIITSILMRAKPHEVKMMMIDPKMVELNVYNGVPHLLAPVVTEPKKAAQALKRVVSEMERRYELFSHTGTRNIEGYNEGIRRANNERDAKQPTLPYIVVIVDELADLMMVASGDVEDAIIRLAQMARAAGIHLIIATQRPSVDVITGIIKANIPSRIAFSVSSQTDSRTILDMGGAEKLLGRGDMLFFPSGTSKPTRVQGAFLSDQEVEKIVEFVIGQQKAQYQKDMIPTEEAQVTMEVEDDLFPEAVKLVVDMQTASVSMLQRRFRIGYSRAARLVDAMEAKGVIGPYEGSKPREVLLTSLPEQNQASS